mgnify:CR=1 FL=1
MTSGSSKKSGQAKEARRGLRESSVAGLKAALARWSSPETLRNVRPYNHSSDRIRYYAGVLVPGCFYNRRGRCYLDECGKDACQRECEYLFEVLTVLRRFKKKGISLEGAQERMLCEAEENLKLPATEQTNLSDWL